MIIEKVRLFTSMLILLLASEVGSAEPSPLIAVANQELTSRIVASVNLNDRRMGLNEDDQRNIVDLFVDQVEFANVIIINNCDLVTPYDLEQLTALFGNAIDEENIRQLLDACLLTDLEYVQGPDAWASHADPFPPVELGDPNEMEEAVQ